MNLVSEVIAYDDLDGAEGPIHGRITPTGEVWEGSGPGGAFAFVEDGWIRGDTAQANSNAYLTLNPGKGPLAGVACVIDFWRNDLTGTAVTGKGVQAVIMLQAADSNLTKMLHAQINVNGCILDLRNEDDPTIPDTGQGRWRNGIAGEAGGFTVPKGAKVFAGLFFEHASNEYRFVVATANSILFDSGWATHPDIPALPDLTKATWQIGGPQNAVADGYSPRISSPVIGGFKRGGMPIHYLDAPPLPSRKSGLRTIEMPDIRLEDATYHRFFEADTLSSYVDAGMLVVNAINSDQAYFFGVYSVNTRAGMLIPEILPIFETGFGGVPLVIRATNGAAGSAIDIKVTNADVKATDVSARLTGFGIRGNFGFAKPGVAAMTNSTERAVPTASTVREVSKDITTASWVQVATASTAVNGGVLIGSVEVTVTWGAVQYGRAIIHASAYRQLALDVPKVEIQGDLITGIRLSRDGVNIKLEIFTNSAQPKTVKVRQLGENGLLTLGPIIENSAPFATEAIERTNLAPNAAAIANVAGGATVDAESRTAINAILAVMRAKGDIAT
jgi:hypothetical protein